MAQATETDAWTETFLITIQPKAGSSAQFASMITTYDINDGEKTFTGIPNAAGGRVKHFTPQGDTEVTLEGYATQVGNNEGFYGLIHTDDVSQPLVIATDRTRVQYALGVMQTTDTSATDVFAETTQDERVLRDVFKNGHFVSCNQSFTDNICKFTLKFKVTPFDKDGSSNISYESTDGSGTSQLDAVTYT